MLDITASIVAYKNEAEILKKTIYCLLNTGMNIKICLVDNSPSDEMRNICQDKRIEYIFNPKNLGFGAGHNIAIRKALAESKYHLVINPDIFFAAGALEKLYSFMEENNNVGLVMPRVLSEDGSDQHLCKLLPTPFNLILRRFNFIFYRFFKKKQQTYEFRFANYREQMDVPCLSGCFMFIRNEIFKKIGVFDERFFIYLEDVDLCRRIHKYYRTVYFPEVSIYHVYAKSSYANLFAFQQHCLSAVRYFNKWGWFFDRERQEMNKDALAQF